MATVAVEIAFGQSVGYAFDALDWVDVTDRVRVGGSVDFNRGRTLPGQGPAAGTCAITLDNSDAALTPGRDDGPYGLLTTRCPLRVVADGEPLWCGFVTSWEWAAGGEYRVAVNAADILSVAGKTQCLPWLEGRNRHAPAVAGDVAFDDVDVDYDDADASYAGATDNAPTGYWPFNDPAGSTSLASGLPGGEPASVVSAGGTVTLGVTSDLVPDSDTVCAQATTGTEASLLQGAAYTGVGGTYHGGGTAGDVLLSGWWRWVGTEARQILLVNVATTATVPWVSLRVGEGAEEGRLIVYEGGYRNVYGSSNLLGSTWHHIAVGVDQSYSPAADPDNHLRVWLDGVEIARASRAVNAGTSDIRVLPGQRLWWANGPWNGQTAHLSVWGVGDDTDVDGLVAHLADRGTTQPTAYARWLQLPYLTTAPTPLLSWLTADATADALITAQATGGKRLVDVAQQVSDTEAGTVVAARDGRLWLQSSRANADPHLTLDAATDVLAVAGAFTLEDVDAVDEAAVTIQPAGTVVRSTRSGTDLSVQSTAMDVWAAEPTQAESIAAWLTGRDVTTPRSPSLTISVSWAATQGWDGDLMTLEIGDTIAVVGLPSQAPAESMTLTVESIAHSIGTGAWTVTVDTSMPTRLWQIEDSDYGALDASNRLAL